MTKNGCRSSNYLRIILKKSRVLFKSLLGVHGWKPKIADSRDFTSIFRQINGWKLTVKNYFWKKKIMIYPLQNIFWMRFSKIDHCAWPRCNVFIPGILKWNFELVTSCCHYNYRSYIELVIIVCWNHLYLK